MIRIEPAHGGVRLAELWSYRELLFFLVWRDFKLRYKQTILGILWAILQPLLATAVFSLFFGALAGIPSDGVPYPVFALAGLVPWFLFSNSLAQAANSVVGNADMITKVYFPRALVPAGSVLAHVPDFLLSSLALAGFMIFYGIRPDPAAALWLPALFLLTLLTAFGAGLWLAALNVEYRDIRHVVPFLLQFWLFATPIAYPSSLLEEAWRPWYGLNPMAGIVEGWRWALLGTGVSPAAMIMVSLPVSVVVFAGGLAYFMRMERTFADVI